MRNHQGNFENVCMGWGALLAEKARVRISQLFYSQGRVLAR
jgi:hypothetical protein